MIDYAIMIEWDLRDAGEFLRLGETRGVVERISGNFHSGALDQRIVTTLDDLVAEMNKDLGDVDLHGADFIASAAER